MAGEGQTWLGGWGGRLGVEREEKCKGDRLNARKWIWNMEWMVNASYMSFIERVVNESTRYMY